MGTSICGRFFSCDDGPTTDVIIGSIETGRNVVVCCSETSFGSEQHTHPHPYLTPDLKWVIFNSDRSGNQDLWKMPTGGGEIQQMTTKRYPLQVQMNAPPQVFGGNGF